MTRNGGNPQPAGAAGGSLVKRSEQVEEQQQIQVEVQVQIQDRVVPMLVRSNGVGGCRAGARQAHAEDGGAHSRRGQKSFHRGVLSVRTAGKRVAPLLVLALSVGCATPVVDHPTPPVAVSAPSIVPPTFLPPSSEEPVKLIPRYSRERFGPAWKDTDRNGCDQRADVLIRDAAQVTHTRCDVTSIVLHDPYTGQTLTREADIQIDHVVSLKAAWLAGASEWSDAQRTLFANDHRNLLAVHGPVNQAKGDRAPELFRHLIQPSAWCRVARIYTDVSATWGLVVTPASREALTGMLATCPA
jgi:Protein of unknown function (DUF1524)